MTGIRVAFDLTFTVKAWTEAERYRFLEFVSSQSTMHRIAKFDLSKQYNKYVDPRMIEIMNELKDRYNETQDKEDYLRLLYAHTGIPHCPKCGKELAAQSAELSPVTTARLFLGILTLMFFRLCSAAPRIMMSPFMIVSCDSVIYTAFDKKTSGNV